MKYDFPSLFLVLLGCNYTVRSPICGTWCEQKHIGWPSVWICACVHCASGFAAFLAVFSIGQFGFCEYQTIRGDPCDLVWRIWSKSRSWSFAIVFACRKNRICGHPASVMRQANSSSMGTTPSFIQFGWTWWLAPTPTSYSIGWLLRMAFVLPANCGNTFRQLLLRRFDASLYCTCWVFSVL